AAWNPQDNFAVRKLLDDQGVSYEQAHELIAEAMDSGLRLVDVLGDRAEIMTLAVEVLRVATLDGLEPSERVQQLRSLIAIGDESQLADELAADPITSGGTAAADEEAEAVQTAGSMQPLELMTIVRSKGLSACHVMVIGCDEVNLRVSDLAFF